MSPQSNSTDPSAESSQPSEHDQSPGCMPAVLAATALMGVVGFIFCGVMTWLIFQKQDVLALRALRGSFIPAVEQSRLTPEEKTETVRLLDEFADELERGKIEGWQASGVMQRLQRLPVLQWGQLRRIEAFVDDQSEQFSDDASNQFDRLRKGVEQGDVTTIDFQHILSPVLRVTPQSDEAKLVDPLEAKAVADVIERARLVADRSDVAKAPKFDVGIDTLVRRQIEAGIKEGSF